MFIVLHDKLSQKVKSMNEQLESVIFEQSHITAV